MAAWRIIVDRDLCEANAVCVKLAPALFRMSTDSDRMEQVQESPTTEQLALAQKAVRMCPRGALELEEVS